MPAETAEQPVEVGFNLYDDFAIFDVVSPEERRNPNIESWMGVAAINVKTGEVFVDSRNAGVEPLKAIVRATIKNWPYAVCKEIGGIMLPIPVVIEIDEASTDPMEGFRELMTACAEKLRSMFTEATEATKEVGSEQ